MNAGLVNPPAMPASMAAASEEENGPATCADPSPPCVAVTYALSGRRTSRHQTRATRWRRRRRGGRTLRNTRSWAAAPSRPRGHELHGQHLAQPRVHVVMSPSRQSLSVPSGPTVGLRHRPPPQAPTLDHPAGHPNFTGLGQAAPRRWGGCSQLGGGRGTMQVPVRPAGRACSSVRRRASATSTGLSGPPDRSGPRGSAAERLGGWDGRSRRLRFLSEEVGSATALWTGRQAVRSQNPPVPAGPGRDVGPLRRPPGGCARRAWPGCW